MANVKKDTPSFHRNIEPILTVLDKVFTPPPKRLLEISSGSGQHMARFANRFGETLFQPTEYDTECLASIDAWNVNNANVSPALALDVMEESWFDENVEKFDAIFCSNVIHITPWDVTTALFAGASKYLNQESQVVLYGPYKVDGKHTSERDVEFDVWLKEKDAFFGIRDIEAVRKVAAIHGFDLDSSHPIPANNFIQVFKREA